MFLGTITVHSLNTVSTKHILYKRKFYRKFDIHNIKLKKYLKNYSSILPSATMGKVYILPSATVPILSLFTATIDVPITDTKKNLLSWQLQKEKNNSIKIKNKNK